MKNIFNRFLSLFSEDLGIDLGTSNTLICVRKKGILLNTPSVVAFNNRSKEVFAVGEEAKNMIGRTPANIEAIRPLKNGVIADYEVTEKMLRAFYKIVTNGKKLSAPRVLICVPAGVTQVEKRAVIDISRDAGAREAFLIEEPMAAAIGAGIDVFQPEGNLIVDIGGGTTEIGVVSLGGIVITKSLKIAGDKFDSLIIDYIRKAHNILIGYKTAETLKKEIGAAVTLEEELTYGISGRNLISGLPVNIEITSTEISSALEETTDLIVEEIKLILEKTPPELASDIKKTGIYLTGGGALLRGLDKKLANSLKLNVTVVENPLNAVIDGISIFLENFNKYIPVLMSTENNY
jgi:rod shape-determining protein MreB